MRKGLPALRPQRDETEGRFLVRSNPDVNPVIGFSVISADNILAFTKSAILHFDGQRWTIVFTSGNSVIGCMGTDGRYVAFTLEMVRFGQAMTIAPLYVGILKKTNGKFGLYHLRSVNVPLGHSLTDIKFTGDGAGFVASIFEDAYFRIDEGPGGRVSVDFAPHQLPLGLASGGGLFGTCPFDKRFPIVASTQGAIAEACDTTLRITPILDIYSHDGPSFDMNEVLMSSSMFDSDRVFFLSNERLFVVSREESGGLNVCDDSAIKTAGGRSIRISQLSAVLAMNDTDIYALTQAGLLLRGEYSPKTGGIKVWRVSSVLPTYGTAVMARLNDNEILIGGSSIIEYYTDSSGISPNVAPPNRRFYGATVFSPSIFDAGATYGVGIGNFKEGSENTYIYLVQISGDNRLYVYKKGSVFPGPSLDIATQSGAAGRPVETSANGSNSGVGTVIGDIKEDGSDDIIVSYLIGPPAVLVNNGTGFFRDETAGSGLNKNLLRSECVTLGDVNNDGYLDLFAASFEGTDRLFINEGGGKFKDVTRDAGIRSGGRSITAVFGDLNGDGYPDLYVGRWNAENSLYLNNGDGTFRDDTKESGTGCGVFHETNSVLLADFNNDGRLDIFVGNREGGNRLFINEGDGRFKDVSRESGLLDSMYTYGSAYGDFSDDGRLDILAAGLTTVKFFKNKGNDRDGVPIFRNETSRFLPLSNYYSGYNTGVATFDADGNGDLDAIVGQFQGHTIFLRNNYNALSGRHNDFIEVNVKGDESNRDGIGAVVKLLENGKMVAYREVIGSYGYASSSSRTQLFGITDKDARYDVEVDFPASGVKRIVRATPGSILTVHEHNGMAMNYFLLRKDITRVVVSGRFRTVALESFLIVIFVFLLSWLKLPRLNAAGRLRTLKAKIVLSAVALSSFIAMNVIAYSLEQIFFSRSTWISGSDDIFRNYFLPVFLTFVIMFVYARARGSRENREILSRDAFRRVYVLLRKFAHGDRHIVVLNRLALFVENLDDFVNTDTARHPENNAGGDSLSGADGENEAGDPKTRFLAVVQEYEGVIVKEVRAMTATVELIEGKRYDGLELLHERASTLASAAENLSGNLRELKTLVTGTKSSSRTDWRLRSDTIKQISVIKSALGDMKKNFEDKFISEVGRVVSEEVGKFRTEYRDLLFRYEDRSGGSRGIISGEELREVISILINNGIEAISSAADTVGPGVISTTVSLLQSGVVIEVEDNGPGLPDGSREQIFSGNFTTKGDGHGFGLRYASSSLSKYGGQIGLENSAVGTKFVLTIEKAP